MADDSDVLGELNSLFDFASRLAVSTHSVLQESLEAREPLAALNPQQTEFLISELKANQARIENVRALLKAGQPTSAVAAPKPTGAIVGKIRDTLGKTPVGPEFQVRIEHAPYVIDVLDEALKGFRSLCTPHSSGGGPDDAVLLSPIRRLDGPHGSGGGPDD